MMGFGGDTQQGMTTVPESAQLTAADLSLSDWAQREIRGFISTIYKIIKMCLMVALGLWVLLTSLCLAPFAAFFIFFVVMPAALFMGVPVMLMLAGYQGVEAVRARLSGPAPVKALTQHKEVHVDAIQEEEIPAFAPAAVLLPEIAAAVVEPDHVLVQEEIQVIEPVNHVEHFDNHVDKGKSEIDQGQSNFEKGKSDVDQGQAKIGQGSSEESHPASTHHVAQEMLVEKSPSQVPIETWEDEKSPKKHSLKSLLLGGKHKKEPHQEVQLLELIEGSEKAHTPRAQSGIEEQVKQVDVVTAPESSPSSLKKKFKDFFLGKKDEPLDLESVKSSEGPQISVVSPHCYSHDEKTTTEGSTSPTGSEVQGPISGGIVGVEPAQVNQLPKQVDVGAGPGEVPASPSVSEVEGKPASRSGQRAGDSAAQQRPSFKKGGRKKKGGRH